MPAIESRDSGAESAASELLEGELRFPPVTRDHILHCSYDYWWPKYRSACIRSRIIPLTPEFVSYLREDGIVLADDEPGSGSSGDAGGDDDDDDWEPTVPSSSMPPPAHAEEEESSEDEDDEEQPAKLPPNKRFPELHESINAAIKDLNGAVAPKLNWSSPKDATWISRHPNTVKCTSANDVYVLLKSSSFVSHDLDHAFDDTTGAGGSSDFNPVLVLRAFFSPLPSLEFRCFVKDRNLVAITQRDLNYYAFLRSLRGDIVAKAQDLFTTLKFSFPDACFVFDIYIPEAQYDSDDEDEFDEFGEKKSRLGRARLIDINPWAPRTDTLLFDWRELLHVRVPRPVLGSAEEEKAERETTGEISTDSEDEEEKYTPELRLIEQDDPAAYNFSSPQYSAHKLPKDVVDASNAGEGGMREFIQRWDRMTGGRR
ncbi:D123-domain-containing protein [Diplogelasinospora grovesii]|uniref:D123-domain-containing protein n=1 Tax=Diplogelasinospora grovesii TaxID=303347 RepID=A0AAN6NF12_9PEZI|nr:D123-domain-containing protein [Diplogelasinospora grovesii]